MGIELGLVLLVLFGSLLIGMPVALALGFTGFFLLAVFADLATAVNATQVVLAWTPLNFVLTSIPLFILMAELVMITGLAAEAYRALEKMFSGFPAGLVLATIGAGTFMAMVSGSSAASASATGPIGLQEMVEKRGYAKHLAAGGIAAAGGLASIIPPSTLAILYGYIGEVNVAAVFIAGIIPGFMMAVNYCLITWGLVAINPSWAPAARPLTLRQRFSGLAVLIPFVFLFFLIISSLVLGLSTPTEAGAIGVFGALIIALVFRKLSFKKLTSALRSTVRVCGFFFFIILGAKLFGFLTSYLMLPQQYTQATVSLSLGPMGTLLMVIVLLLLLGCLMDGASLMLVVVPVILPTLLNAGLDPIWLGIVIMITLEMGVTTPPVGMLLFVLQGIGTRYGVSYADVVKGATPYLIGDSVVITLVILFPIIALWLPGITGF